MNPCCSGFQKNKWGGQAAWFTIQWKWGINREIDLHSGVKIHGTWMVPLRVRYTFLAGAESQRYTGEVIKKSIVLNKNSFRISEWGFIHIVLDMV